jgi:type I restriction enzyme, S subunit
MSSIVLKEWESTKLGQITERIDGGGTPSRNNPKYWGGEIPWATVKDLTGTNLTSTEETITREGLEESSSRIIPKNTIIIAARMAVGKAVIFDKDVAINQDLKAIFPKNSISTRFLHQWFLSKSSYIEAMGTGSTVKGIRLEELREIQFLLPPLPEQQKIASILNSVDGVIEKTQAQIDKLRDLKKGTMNELLTHGIGHTEFKDSPVGRIPKGWGAKTLSEFVIEYRGGAALKPSDFCEEGFPVIPKKAIQFGGRVIFGRGVFCSWKFADKNRNNWVDQRFAIATLRDLVPSGPSIGLVGELEETGSFILAQGVYGFLLKDGLAKKYFSQLSNTDWYRSEMKRIFVGSTQVHIRTGEFQDLLIPVPSLSEQNEITSILTSIDTMIEENHVKLQKTKSLKISLMQDLLTGKVRVLNN